VTSRRTFGEALRAERERRGITLDAIASRTKISVSLLAALERGDCSRWPGGLYSRAYVREYAGVIGLDRDQVAARFGECFADTAFPDREPVPAVPAPEPPPSTLRLTIVEDRPERLVKTLARRAVLVLLDLFLVVTVATVISIAGSLGFWAALAYTALCCHAIALALGGHSTAGLFASVSLTRLVRSPRRQPSAAASESAVAEPA
jgi:Helix-turn-helix domain